MAKKLIRTPKGVAVWPKLHKPDTKFDAAGVYGTKLRLSGDDAATLKDAIDAAIDASMISAKKALEADGKPTKKLKRADAPYTEEEDGAVVFNFKLKASGKTKEGEVFTQKVALFDAVGKPLPKGVQVGSGSVVRLSYEMFEFYTPLVGAGVSLRLRAAQVIDLKTWDGGDSTAYGFETEDGYDSAEAAAEEDEDEDDDADEVPAKSNKKATPTAADDDADDDDDKDEF